MRTHSSDTIWLQNKETKNYLSLITYPLYDTFMGWQTNPLMGLEMRGTDETTNM